MVIGTGAYLKDLIVPDSLLLDKIQSGAYELAISNAVEKAYQSGFRKHGMAAIISERRMLEVRTKLAREKKLIVMNDSEIKSKTKKVQLKGLIQKYSKFVKLAIASSASHLITYASHHLERASMLDKHFNIKALLPDDFLSDK